jgi:ribonucleoside-diphosphate reductase alpha chain
MAISEIRNPDGSVVFHADDVEVPASWSQVAADVIAQKYFRKAGVPARLKRVEEETVPSWLWRSVPDTEALSLLPEDERMVGETSAKQVFHRLAGTWTYWGWKGGYFDSEADAQAFYDELACMLAKQIAAPNSPQWFNTGLHWAYGIDGPSQGHVYVDYQTGKLTKSKSAYEHPQPHACFIQSISDDLVNEGGIMDLWVREARIFKYGSGTGSNFSRLRGEGERLSGGGKSSGLMSFLKIGLIDQLQIIGKLGPLGAAIGAGHHQRSCWSCDRNESGDACAYRGPAAITHPDHDQLRSAEASGRANPHHGGPGRRGAGRAARARRRQES